MSIIWGTEKWQACSVICIILIFGYGTYTLIMDIIAGHPIWWYNLSFVIFALTILGLVLLVRQGWVTLRNIVSYGFNPTKTDSLNNEEPEDSRDYTDDIYRNDEYFPEDKE